MAFRRMCGNRAWPAAAAGVLHTFRALDDLARAHAYYTRSRTSTHVLHTFRALDDLARAHAISGLAIGRATFVIASRPPCDPPWRLMLQPRTRASRTPPAAAPHLVRCTPPRDPRCSLMPRPTPACAARLGAASPRDSRVATCHGPRLRALHVTHGPNTFRALDDLTRTRAAAGPATVPRDTRVATCLGSHMPRPTAACVARHLAAPPPPSPHPSSNQARHARGFARNPAIASLVNAYLVGIACRLLSPPPPPPPQPRPAARHN